MPKNNWSARLAVLAVLFIVRTAQAAGIEISDARAELATDEPRRVEIYFVLRNATGHRLQLMKVASGAGEVVEMKQRSFGADGTPRVWPVARFDLADGSTTRLVREGRFLQVTALAAGLRVGQRVPLTLTFEDEQPVTVQLTLQQASAGR
jgi:copper(I)-binding protein